MLETVDFICIKWQSCFSLLFSEVENAVRVLVITFSFEISRLIKKIMHKSFHLNKCPTDYLNVQLEMFKYGIVTLFSGLGFPVKISTLCWRNLFSALTEQHFD